jgi:hypothetical protein
VHSEEGAIAPVVLEEKKGFGGNSLATEFAVC